MDRLWNTSKAKFLSGEADRAANPTPATNNAWESLESTGLAICFPCACWASAVARLPTSRLPSYGPAAARYLTYRAIHTPRG